MSRVGPRVGISNIVIPSLILAVLLIASGPLFEGETDTNDSDSGVVHLDPGDVNSIESDDQWDSDPIVTSYSEGIGRLP